MLDAYTKENVEYKWEGDNPLKLNYVEMPQFDASIDSELQNACKNYGESTRPFDCNYPFAAFVSFSTHITRILDSVTCFSLNVASRSELILFSKIVHGLNKTHLNELTYISALPD